MTKRFLPAFAWMLMSPVNQTTNSHSAFELSSVVGVAGSNPVTPTNKINVYSEERYVRRDTRVNLMPRDIGDPGIASGA